jgi:hypothetical protein
VRAIQLDRIQTKVASTRAAVAVLYGAFEARDARLQINIHNGHWQVQDAERSYAFDGCARGEAKSPAIWFSEIDVVDFRTHQRNRARTQHALNAKCVLSNFSVTICWKRSH